jgi:hypothetical protein
LLAPALCGARRLGLLHVRRLAFAASHGLLRVPLCLPCAACRFDSAVGTSRWPPFAGLPVSGLLRLHASPFPLTCVRVEPASAGPCEPTFWDQPLRAVPARAFLAVDPAAQRLRALPRSRIAPRPMRQPCAFADCSARCAWLITALPWCSIRVALAGLLDAW